MHPYTNALINETSPYLLQHAHNPVNWYPWGDEALQKAQDENKMLIISVGYSACHWCHVMEHESFEDTTVAKLMNDHFVAIKVDREERPDVDQIYMDAAHLINGSGGWPLNALATPDGKPFYAGTYYPKKDWIKVLEHFIKINAENPEAVLSQAEQVTNGIINAENVVLNTSESNFQLADLDRAFTKTTGHIDMQKGGANRAPKFPMPAVWEFMLHYGEIAENAEAINATEVTLNNMAFGGIYDQIGGGFARYSTDEDWFAPHFEKMLYDNGQLVSLYTHAWQQSKNPLYKEIVYETLKFVAREMTTKDGAFYSAYDADSEGEEGKYYVWTQAEIEANLGPTAAATFIEYYNVKANGNWEHGNNILYRNDSDETIAKKLKMPSEAMLKSIAESSAALLSLREQRVKPGLDDKILTSWNGLMLKGYVDAYRAFGEKRFLDAAEANAAFILKNAYSKTEGLTRTHKDGISSIPAFLDDYAFTIAAFIDLYQATFDEKWLHTANDLCAYTLEHFSDDASGMFFYTHDNHSNLIARKMEVADNVIPASNSQMAHNLFLLGHYFYKEAYIEKAETMLNNVKANFDHNLYFYANWARLEALMVSPLYEVAIVGKDFEKIRKELGSHFLPNVILLGGKSEGSLELLQSKLMKGETTIYVCQNKSCQLPVNTAEAALEQMGK